MSNSPRRQALIFSQVYPPDPTSVGQHMHDAAVELAQRGLEVTVYAAARGYEDPTQRYPKHETRDGVRIRRLPLSSFGKASILNRLVGGISFTLQCLIRGLLKPSVTHMLVSTSPPMCSFAAVFVGAIRRRMRITFWVMDLNPDQMVALGKLKETSWMVKSFDWLNRRILKRADAVVALDRFMADRLNRKLDVGDAMHILPPWPHEDHIEPVAHQDNSFRKEHGLDGKTVVMYSGNLSPASPVTTILEAAKQLEEVEELVFLFVGGGLVKREIDELIARAAPPNIRSLPYQPIERLRYSLSAADVHLVSVGNEIVGICHPCKVYGAMAVSRPILSLCPIPCHVSDIVAGKNVGWAIEHGDVDGAVKALREIHAASTESLMESGQRARNIIDERFTKQYLCGAFCDIVVGE
ncbi:glycosyltransferase family 4 protein [Pirellulales bacterium]|nr:glycosyltransferase family 4 protein [Pirellulales bacterium]